MSQSIVSQCSGVKNDIVCNFARYAQYHAYSSLTKLALGPWLEYYSILGYNDSLSGSIDVPSTTSKLDTFELDSDTGLIYAIRKGDIIYIRDSRNR